MERRTKSYGIAALAILSVILVACSGFVFDSGSRTTFTAAQSEDSNLDVIHCWGDYKYDEYLKTGCKDLDSFYSFLSDNITEGRRINGINPVNCSTFVTLNEDGTGYYAGRNFDYRYCKPMLVYTDAPDAYASVSTIDGRMFGNTDELFSEIRNDARFNAAPYLPMDGLNEKGVYVCINSVNSGKGFIQTEAGKTTLFITSAIRLILDHADSTESAIRLLDGFNIFSDVDYHLFICDSTGDSRAVEFVGPNKYVNETKLMTNHYIAKEGSETPVKPSSAYRFAVLTDAMSKKPRMTESDVRETMREVMQNDPDKIHYTRWSVVYDLEGLKASICIRIGDDMRWDAPYHYNIREYGSGMLMDCICAEAIARADARWSPG